MLTNALFFAERTDPSSAKTVQLRFLLNPTEFVASSTDPSRVEAVVCERMALEGPPASQRAVSTGEFETIPASLVLVSIGYRGQALPETNDWFDTEKGVYKNDRGLINSATEDLGGLYTSGWLKRGPTGIIGTNIADAKETVAQIVSTVEPLPQAKAGREAILPLLQKRGVPVVNWAGYQRIVASESANKRHENQPREKITDASEMLKIASS